jgi:hypothetical protein
MSGHLVLTRRFVFILFAVIAPNQVRAQPPADFDFRLRYGLCSTTDELDTFTGWFTRQLPDGTSVMAQLSLNVSQRQYLWETVEKINFFNYPSTFRGQSRQPPIVQNRSRFVTYQMEVRSNGRAHSLQ